MQAGKSRTTDVTSAGAGVLLLTDENQLVEILIPEIRTRPLQPQKVQEQAKLTTGRQSTSPTGRRKENPTSPCHKDNKKQKDGLKHVKHVKRGRQGSSGSSGSNEDGDGDGSSDSSSEFDEEAIGGDVNPMRRKS